MGARDGATQAAIPHMIYDASRSTSIHLLDNSSRDHKLILGTPNKYLPKSSLDERAREDRKSVV